MSKIDIDSPVVPSLTPPDKSDTIAAPVNQSFRKDYNWLALVPLLAIIFTAVVSDASSPGGSLVVVAMALVDIAALVAMLFLYVTQTKYIKIAYPHKHLRPQAFLLLAAIIVLALAATCGDISGAQQFGDNPDGIGVWLYSGLVGLVLSVSYIYAIVLFNILYITYDGSAKGLKIVGRIGYCIGWLIIAMASYIVYAIAYSSHDPSTE